MINKREISDYTGVQTSSTKLTPILGLLTGATVWGLVWYPYRVLAQAGVGAELAATLTYVGASVLWGLLFWRKLGGVQAWGVALLLGVSAGWTNIGFTLGVVYGVVMRVVLLFYLAPVWTVIFARLLLGEKLSGVGYGLIVLACVGAMTMLWQPEMGWPLPRSAAEWIALSAGVAFALSNVLARKASGLTIEIKALVIFLGGGALGLICVFINQPEAAGLRLTENIVLLMLLAIVILSVNIAVQFGLSRVSANRAIVIYLFELVVTAVSAWLLAGELLTFREWCGGAMIVAAGLASDRLGGAQESRA